MYTDRIDAGKRLAQVLRHFKGKDTVVLALPRGGVVLGAEVAKELEAPLGLVLVKKIGHPAYPEYAIGAIAEQEPAVYNEEEMLAVDKVWLKRAEAAAREIINERRERYYGHEVTPPPVKDKTVILVDDGIATGLTMEAAVRAVKSNHAKRVVVAVPVAPQDSLDTLENLADEVVVLEKPDDFKGAVGSHYQQFDQVDDEEVAALLMEVYDDLH